MPSFSFYATKTNAELEQSAQTSLTDGLSQKEVEKRRQQVGLNHFDIKAASALRLFLRQFHSPFIYLLIAAAIVELFLFEYVDAGMIILFVLIDTLLGFSQEYHSEKTLRLLRTFVSVRVRVRRDGEEVLIDSAELVPGDIMIVEAGERLSADLRFFEQHHLTIDESALTGESLSVSKEHTRAPAEPHDLFKASNIGFSGTTVVEGRGVGIVIATGKETVLGGIAKTTLRTERRSTFEKGVGAFSKLILRFIFVTLILIFLSNMFLKGEEVDLFQLLFFSIALAISVIPEALPVVMTFSLSRGALRLAKKKVVVKRLSAIEDLGSIDILCTDKTGTLTENALRVAAWFPRRDTVLETAALAGSHFDEREQHSQNSFDLALWKMLSLRQKKSLKVKEKVLEAPFDPNHRRNSVVVKKKKGYECIVRGAPEAILSLCAVTQTRRAELEQWIREQGSEGRRVIALASKQLDHLPSDMRREEKELDFVGCVSFVDPVKRTAQEAVVHAKELGVAIKILTGDSREVAGAVAHHIGLIASPDEVLTGEQFSALSEEKKHEAVGKFAVFARVSPQQKFEIIRVLQKDHEVGFLGEGMNDAPALKAANVGLVVNDATDIAREAADIFLLKKSLSVVIDGIREGRGIFANTLKYIRATLSSNFGNFYAVAIASLFLPYLPMLPLQILLLNLLSDFPMIAIAADSVDRAELFKPRRYNMKDIAVLATFLGIVSTVFDFILFGYFRHGGEAVLQTNWFIGSVLTELAFLFSVRTRLPFWQARRPSWTLFFFTGLAAAITLVIPFTAIGREVFTFIQPSWQHLFFTGEIVVLFFLSSELVKYLYYRYANNKI